MSYQFDATKDYQRSNHRVEILIKFAKQEGVWGHDENRNLFLKLGVVLIVTQFQVFVEKSLEEYHYLLKQSHQMNGQLPLHYRLNILKLHFEQAQIHEKLKNPTQYDLHKLSDIKSFVHDLNGMCDDNATIPAHSQITKKYRMGKQGLNELRSLFMQIEGRDIFALAKFDILKLNEILNRRHNIIHEDSNDQLTEITVKSYKDFILKVVKHIDTYLATNLYKTKK